MYNKILDLENLQAVNEVFKRLNILRRWTSITTDDKYNELAKQALNCITAFMLASEYEKQGNIVNWERFPKIAIYRAFQKVYVYFDTPEHLIDEICNLGNINRDCFNMATKEIIQELTNDEFSDFISEGIGTTEMEIYRAATKIATLIELEENSPLMKNNGEYRDKYSEIENSLRNFSHISGVSDFSDPTGEIFKLLLKISKLRNQNRWAVQPYTINCSVLGHLFDTGVLAYFIGLEHFEWNEKISTKMFFMGIFHDLAEVWTSDVPSPIKDRISGFRAATEKYESMVLNKNLYSRVPEFLAAKLRSVMFEEEANSSFHSIMKSADYLSADSECWRQYISGSRDPYFLESAIMGFDKKLKNGTYYLPETCNQLHEYYMTYSQNAVK